MHGVGQRCQLHGGPRGQHEYNTESDGWMRAVCELDKSLDRTLLCCGEISSKVSKLTVRDSFMIGGTLVADGVVRGEASSRNRVYPDTTLLFPPIGSLPSQDIDNRT